MCGWSIQMSNVKICFFTENSLFLNKYKIVPKQKKMLDNLFLFLIDRLVHWSFFHLRVESVWVKSIETLINYTCLLTFAYTRKSTHTNRFIQPVFSFDQSRVLNCYCRSDFLICGKTLQSDSGFRSASISVLEISSGENMSN